MYLDRREEISVQRLRCTEQVGAWGWLAFGRVHGQAQLFVDYPLLPNTDDGL